MEKYQYRVIDESRELSEKIEKLNCFIGREDFIDVGATDASILERQLDAMKQYSNILQVRIARFKEEEKL